MRKWEVRLNGGNLLGSWKTFKSPTSSTMFHLANDSIPTLYGTSFTYTSGYLPFGRQTDNKFMGASQLVGIRVPYGLCTGVGTLVLRACTVVRGIEKCNPNKEKPHDEVITYILMQLYPEIGSFELIRWQSSS